MITDQSHFTKSSNIYFANLVGCFTLVSCITSFKNLNIQFLDYIIDLCVSLLLFLMILLKKRYVKALVTPLILLPMLFCAILISKGLYLEAVFLIRNFIYFMAGYYISLSLMKKNKLIISVLVAIMTGFLITKLDQSVFLSGFTSAGALGFAAIILFTMTLLSQNFKIKLSKKHELKSKLLQFSALVISIISTSKTSVIIVLAGSILYRNRVIFSVLSMLLVFGLFIAANLNLFTNFYAQNLYKTPADFIFGSFMLRLEDRHAVLNFFDYSLLQFVVGPPAWIGPEISIEAKRLGPGDGLLPFLIGNFGLVGLFSYVISVYYLLKKRLHVTLSLICLIGLTRNIVSEDILLLMIGLTSESEYRKNQFGTF